MGQIDPESSSDAGSVTFTATQFNQFLKKFSGMNANSSSAVVETDDELEHIFGGMVTCCNAAVDGNVWIIDSGASDHMTYKIDAMKNSVLVNNIPSINLPNGVVSKISHIGDIKLADGLLLKGVLGVPTFKHNLLCVNKLNRDNDCNVMFHSGFCLIRGNSDQKIVGLGKLHNGLYYLIDSPADSVKLKALCSAFGGKATSSEAHTSVELFTLWHNRLGHAPTPKLKLIPALADQMGSYDCTCITCPMARFVKQPFQLSKSVAKSPFEIIHIDIWGPYKRFVSRDVKFHEHIFPYNNATLKSILQPVPTDTPQTPSPLQYEDLSPIHLASDSVTQNTDEVPSSPADNPPPSLSQNRSEHIEPQTQQPEIRKSTRPRQEPFWMKDYKKVALNAELECSQR
uniref:Retrovirus-related Pol polyprotein from transposon TNT 1-94-like beta-barrel domain-containing protein n=1 Tax=Chenopodium quinoa TaxID=63459 RepID=A0A803L036_CHEQI